MKNPMRREYLKDFQKNAKGEYVYLGKVFNYDRDDKKARTILLLLCFLSAAPVIASGFTTAGGMGNAFYVILAYALEVSSVLGVGWNTLRLIFCGNKIKEFILSSVSKFLPVFSGGLSIISIISIVCIAVFIFLNGTEGKTGECVMLFIFKLVAAACSFTLNRFFRSISFIELEGES